MGVTDKINYIMNISRRLTKSIPAALWITLIILAAAALKILLVAGGTVPFNSDEAVVALMGRHILAGERPVFFYGQAYMGSLDAYLVAIFFQLFGQQVWVVRLVQGLLFAGTLLTTFWIGKLGFNSEKIGLLAMAIMAFPAVNVTLYTTVSLGGYGEALFIGNLLLLDCLLISKYLQQPGSFQGAGYALLAGWGLLAGVGIWANGLTLVYSLPSGLALLALCFGRGSRPQWRLIWGGSGLALAGFLVGALPWWGYSLQNGSAALVKELFGSAVAVESSPWIMRSLTHLASLLLLGLPAALGLRPPWDVTWLLLPLIPFILAFWGWTLWRFLLKLRRAEPDGFVYRLLGGVMGVLAAGFIATSFGVDPSGRYFLPLAVPFSLLAADGLLSARRPTWRWALFSLVIVFQLGGTLQCALRQPPGLTTQFDPSVVVDHRYDGELAAFLKSAGETPRLHQLLGSVSTGLPLAGGVDLHPAPALPPGFPLYPS